MAITVSLSLRFYEGQPYVCLIYSLMQVLYKIAQKDDAHHFEHTAANVFDRAIDPDLLQEFLLDKRHHMAIALSEDCIVGFVSAVNYVHPDKPNELWINEINVAASLQNRGIGKALMQLMLRHAHSIGCLEAWVLTERDNVPANALYQSLGEEKGVEHMPSIIYNFNCQ